MVKVNRDGVGGYAEVNTLCCFFGCFFWLEELRAKRSAQRNET